MQLKHSSLDELGARQLYQLMQLREEVFHLEQGITEPDLDGKELAAGTYLFWHENEFGAPVSHARVLLAANVARIGRVAVAASQRQAGLGNQVMQACIEWCFQQEVSRIEILAQAYLENWYGKMGFTRSGDNIIEAGIDHVPMQLGRECWQAEISAAEVEL